MACYLLVCLSCGRVVRCGTIRRHVLLISRPAYHGMTDQGRAPKYSSLPATEFPEFRRAPQLENVSAPNASHLARGASVLRNETSVDAVELFDRASLRECENNEDMMRLVPDIKVS